MEKLGTGTYMWLHESYGMNVGIKSYAKGWAT